MASVAEWVDQLDSADQATAFKANRQLALEGYAAGAPGADAKRNELATELARLLGERNDKNEIVRSARTRGRICRLLADVGGADQVAALVSAADDLKVREQARWALSRIVAGAATDALVAIAQSAVGPEYRIGAINALASRAGSQVASALKQCAVDHDLEVRTAAAEALAAQGETASDQVLEAVLASSGNNPRTRTRVLRARVRLAENLARGGDAAAAKKIFQALADHGNAETDGAQIRAAKLALEKLA